MPAGMLEYARQEGLGREWEDVMEMIEAHVQGTAREIQTSEPSNFIPARPRIQTDQPTYGKPMHAPLNCAPTNENGVIFAFGSVADELGFSITRIQTAFPDCEALREVAPNRWIRVRIEFEYESRNFLTHMHSTSECDLIVCWSHNWPECPLEVLELKSVVGRENPAN